MSSLGRRIGSVALLSLLTNLAVLVKNAALAARFGAGESADLLAYGEAILVFLPTILLLRECFGIFVSIYGRDLETEGPDQAAALSAAALRAVGLVALVLALVVVSCPRPLLLVMAPGLPAAQLEKGAWLLRWISPALLCQEIAEFSRTIHNAHHRYVLPGLVLTAGNVLQAGLLMAMPPAAALTAWILAFNGAALLQAAVLVLGAPGLRQRAPGSRRPRLLSGPPWHPAFRRLGAVVAPVAVGVMLVQLAGVLERGVISYMSAGSLATLAYSRKLLAPLQTLLAASVALPIYVQMSRSKAGDDRLRTSTLARGLQVDLFLFVPVTVLIWVLAPEIVSLAFRRGLFGSKEVLQTTPLLRVGVLAVLPGALLLLLRDFIYTSGRTRPLVLGGVIQLALTAGANLLLARRYGLIWIPVGVAAGTWISFLVLFAIVRARHPEQRVALSRRETAILIPAGLAGTGAALGAKALLSFWGHGSLSAALALLTSAGLAGLLAYTLTALALGHPLARAAVEKLRERRQEPLR